MLVRFQPEYVEKEWDSISDFIDMSIPPGTPNTYEMRVNLLTAILTENLYVWGYFPTEKGIEGEMAAVLLTTFQQDLVIGIRKLMIYAMFTARDLTIDDWRDLVEKLKVEARRFGCLGITGYSNTPEIFSILNEVGGSVKQAIIDIPVA